MVRLYADDTIIYTVAQSLKVTMDSLKAAFSLLQRSLNSLKMVLKPTYSKFIISHYYLLIVRS